MKIISLFWVG